MEKKLAKKKANGEAKQFPSFLDDFFGHRWPGLAEVESEFRERDISIPLANIIEYEDEYLIEFAVPGYSRGEFRVSLEDRELLVRGEKRVREKEELQEQEYRRREFAYGKFSRTFHLPEDVDEEKISAKYNNGMLRIMLPKLEAGESQNRKSIRIS